MKTYVSIKHWAEDDKPRAKLASIGKENLSHAELLAILISTGTRKKSAVDLARDILQIANNDLNKLAKLTIANLCKIEGIGPAKAITIIAAIELGGRRNKAISNRDSVIPTSHDAFTYFRPVLQDKEYEEFWILLLRRNNNIIKAHRVSEGGVSGTVVDPKRVFKAALEANATGIILCHNHPSGNIHPSSSDINITTKLVNAGKNLEIDVLDHIILAGGQYFSFADEGRIT